MYATIFTFVGCKLIREGINLKLIHKDVTFSQRKPLTPSEIQNENMHLVARVANVARVALFSSS